MTAEDSAKRQWHTSGTLSHYWCSHQRGKLHRGAHAEAFTASEMLFMVLLKLSRLHAARVWTSVLVLKHQPEAQAGLIKAAWECTGDGNQVNYAREGLHCAFSCQSYFLSKRKCCLNISLSLQCSSLKTDRCFCCRS